MKRKLELSNVIIVVLFGITYLFHTYIEVAKPIAIFVNAFLFMSGFISGMYQSKILKELDYKSQEELKRAHQGIKGLEKRSLHLFKENNLFIEALKNVAIRRGFTESEILEEKERLRNNKE